MHSVYVYRNRIQERETMTNEEFIRAFEASAISREDWTHEAHIHMAWIYATREGSIADATAKARGGIQRLNAANAIPDHFYHETVTCAFMRLVFDRVQKNEEDWTEFRGSYPELFDRKKPILHRYYSQAVLESEEARKVFVEPDRALFVS